MKTAAIDVHELDFVTLPDGQTLSVFEVIGYVGSDSVTLKGLTHTGGEKSLLLPASTILTVERMFG